MMAFNNRHSEHPCRARIVHLVDSLYRMVIKRATIANYLGFLSILCNPQDLRCLQFCESHHDRTNMTAARGLYMKLVAEGLA
jgi:hypothetical protein